MVGGSVLPLEEGFQPQHHIERIFRSSECRTPLILSVTDGDPVASVAWLAKQQGCAVWTIHMATPRDQQNALDYIEVGMHNGDWVCLTGVELATSDILREIALRLVTLAPDPKHYPRRQLFRLWLLLDQPMDINDRIHPQLPVLLTQNALVGRAAEPPGVSDHPSPEKLLVKHPQEPPLYAVEEEKRARRRAAGRDSDSDSDREQPEEKLTGLWFHRSVDFHAADQGSTITKAADEIFKSVEADDSVAVANLCTTGQIDLDRLRRRGMTPLLYAVSLQKINAVRALLAAGANPNQIRDGDGCPPLFMAIDQTALLQLLVDYGADLTTKFESCRVDNHPYTDPAVAEYARNLLKNR